MKLESEFSKRKAAKDGLYYYCKLCKSEMAHESNLKNSEKIYKKNKEWAQANPNKIKKYKQAWKLANMDWFKAYYKKYVSEHLEKERERKREWNKKNPDKILANGRKWRKENPDKMRESSRKSRFNRKAQKIAGEGKITVQEWQQLKKFYNFTCLKCGRKEPEIKLTLDHVKPLKLGGKNVIQNAQPLCVSCNSSKGAKEIDYRGQAKEVGVWG